MSSHGIAGACADRILMSDLILDRVAEGFAGKGSKIVICQIFQFQFIGGSFQACGIGGGNDRICQFPDLTDRIFKGTVAIDHRFNMLAGEIKDPLLDLLDQALAVAGEELYFFFGGLIGAQQAVLFIPAASMIWSIP